MNPVTLLSKLNLDVLGGTILNKQIQNCTLSSLVGAVHEPKG